MLSNQSIVIIRPSAPPRLPGGWGKGRALSAQVTIKFSLDFAEDATLLPADFAQVGGGLAETVRHRGEVRHDCRQIHPVSLTGETAVFRAALIRGFPGTARLLL